MICQGAKQGMRIQKAKGKTQELFFNFILTDISCFLPFGIS